MCVGVGCDVGAISSLTTNTTLSTSPSSVPWLLDALTCPTHTPLTQTHAQLPSLYCHTLITHLLSTHTTSTTAAGHTQAENAKVMKLHTLDTLGHTQTQPLIAHAQGDAQCSSSISLKPHKVSAHCTTIGSTSTTSSITHSSPLTPSHQHLVSPAQHCLSPYARQVTHHLLHQLTRVYICLQQR